MTKVIQSMLNFQFWTVIVVSLMLVIVKVWCVKGATVLSAYINKLIIRKLKDSGLKMLSYQLI